MNSRHEQVGQNFNVACQIVWDRNLKSVQLFSELVRLFRETLFRFQSLYEITKQQVKSSQWFVSINKQSMTCSVKYAKPDVIIATH